LATTLAGGAASANPAWAYIEPDPGTTPTAFTVTHLAGQPDGARAEWHFFGAPNQSPAADLLVVVNRRQSLTHPSGATAMHLHCGAVDCY
jgi:hypothetical protein